MSQAMVDSSTFSSAMTSAPPPLNPSPDDNDQKDMVEDLQQEPYDNSNEADTGGSGDDGMCTYRIDGIHVRVDVTKLSRH